MPTLVRFACLALLALASAAAHAGFGAGTPPLRASVVPATHAQPGSGSAASRWTWDQIGLAAGLLLVVVTGGVYVAARYSADEGQRDR